MKRQMSTAGGRGDKLKFTSFNFISIKTMAWKCYIVCYVSLIKSVSLSCQLIFQIWQVCHYCSLSTCSGCARLGCNSGRFVMWYRIFVGITFLVASSMCHCTLLTAGYCNAGYPVLTSLSSWVQIFFHSCLLKTWKLYVLISFIGFNFVKLV